MTRHLFGQLNALTEEVADDYDVRVLVLDRPNPDIFIAHFDVNAILDFPRVGGTVRFEKIGGFDVMCERVRTMLETFS